MAPFISIVLTGRNDAHGGDFRDRFLRTLRHNYEQLACSAIPHEFVFVEWSPDAERPWLADIVREALPGLDPAVFRTVLVDPQYQDTLRLNPRLEYLEFVAKNVGIRRAAGQFVLTTNCDVYLGRHVLQTIRSQALEPGVIYRALRVDLKIHTDQSRVGWDLLEDDRNLVRQPRALSPPLYTGGSGDFILLDRATFHELRGFNEVYRAARIGIDHNFLVKAYSNGYRIADIGGPVYHVNHAGSFRVARPQYRGREAEAPWGDSRWPAGRVTYANPDTWGLRDAPERSLGTGRVWLDFDWNAVPPLVDLKRVVLSPSRTGWDAPS